SPSIYPSIATPRPGCQAKKPFVLPAQATSAARFATASRVSASPQAHLVTHIARTTAWSAQTGRNQAPGVDGGPRRIDGPTEPIHPGATPARPTPPSSQG